MAPTGRETATVEEHRSEPRRGPSRYDGCSKTRSFSGTQRSRLQFTSPARRWPGGLQVEQFNVDHAAKFPRVCKQNCFDADDTRSGPHRAADGQLNLFFSGNRNLLWRAGHIAIQCVQIGVVGLLGSKAKVVDKIVDERFLFNLFSHEPLGKVKRGSVFFFMGEIDDRVNAK